MALVGDYGEMWARNTANINLIPGSKEGGQGVYVLYDGSMPVYIGKGNIRSRIRKARSSTTRGPFWDYFSWYTVLDSELQHDIEAFLLRRLPWYLRGLNKQRGKFLDATPHPQEDREPEAITRQKTKKKTKKKKNS
jgi:hypothetical protein